MPVSSITLSPLADVLSAPASFRVERSRIHGQGLFAARAIVTGEPIVEYVGELIDKEESALRQAAQARVYVFEINQTQDLDGDHPDNPARFLNHGCAANCEAVEQGGRIWICAAQAIAEGEELTFDYGYPLAAFPGHPCQCGALSCAGFIVGKENRWRVRRLLNRPARSLLNNHRLPQGDRVKVEN